MSCIANPSTTPIPTLKLNRDVTTHLKRGHRWVFANCFDENVRGVKISSGLCYLSYRDEIQGIGIYQSDTQLRFRMLCLADEPFFKKAGSQAQSMLSAWFEIQWKKLTELRCIIDLSQTNSFRLINGEGDGLPGLIVDVYSDTAVIKHDHPIMERIWDTKALAQKIMKSFPQIHCVYLKRKNSESNKGETIEGSLATETLFKENGLLFASNIRDAAKTGFFLDQRDNRHYLRQFTKNKSVLNLFSYTGGFSVFAAAGGATHVTSVDIAKFAVQAIERNFEINHLKTKIENIEADAFEYLEQGIRSKMKYDLVITDPPSFAPNERAVPQATAAYKKVFSDSLKLVKAGGMFAASSCSSHISNEDFLKLTQEAFSKARLRGTIIHRGGQPFDHPYPLAMEELRYLKFILFRID